VATPVEVVGLSGIRQEGSADYVTLWHELVGETLKYRSGHKNLLQDPELDSWTVIGIDNDNREFHGLDPRTGFDHGVVSSTTVVVP
jgi:hypothetical protein